MKAILLVVLLLGGCSTYPTRNTHVWLLCYKDDTLLPNGMYETNELQYKCNGRRLAQFSTKFGERNTKSNSLNFTNNSSK